MSTYKTIFNKCCPNLIKKLEEIGKIANRKKIFIKVPNSILYGTIYILISNSLSSFVYSIRYFYNKDSLFKNQLLYYPIFFNKYAIFMLSYFCQEQDEENELFSNSSLISVYLYLLELITSLLKKIIPISGLIIIQIICSFLLAVPSFLAYFTLIFLISFMIYKIYMLL